MEIVPQEEKYYVYELAYPESMGGEVFYVGKGTGNRIDMHDARIGRDVNNPKKASVIKDITQKSEKVTKRKIAHFDDELEAYMYEWAMIYMTCRSEKLTNSLKGGWRLSRKVKQVVVSNKKERYHEPQLEYSSISLRIPIELEADIKKLAQTNHRSTRGEILHALYEYVKHPTGN